MPCAQHTHHVYITLHVHPLRAHEAPAAQHLLSLVDALEVDTFPETDRGRY